MKKYIRIYFIILSTTFSISLLNGQDIEDSSSGKKYPQFKFGGLIQSEWSYDFRSDQIPNNEFLLARTRVGVKAKISENLSIEIEADLSDDELIKDAKFEYEFNQYISITAGKHKMPFSMERLTSVGKLIFIDRSKTVREIEDLKYSGRDIGLSLHGLLFDFNRIELEYSVGVFNGTAGDLKGDYNNSKSFAQRLVLNFQKYFSLGFNSSQKLDSVTAKYFVANGVDFIFKPIKNLYFDGEGLIGKKPNGELTGGAYVTAEYEFGDFKIGARFEKYFKDIHDNENSCQLISSKLEWKPKKNIRVQTNLVNIREFDVPSYNEFFISTQIEI